MTQINHRVQITSFYLSLFRFYVVLFVDKKYTGTNLNPTMITCELQKWVTKE